MKRAADHFYQSTYSPVINFVVLMVLLTLMTQFGWNTTVFDITGAFTTAEEKETIMCPVPWGIRGTAPQEIWQIMMGLYGSRHAAVQFYERFRAWLQLLGFVRLLKDMCVFIKVTGEDSMLILAIYVDDAILFEHNAAEAAKEFTKQFKKGLAAALLDALERRQCARCLPACTMKK